MLKWIYWAIGCFLIGAMLRSAVDDCHGRLSRNFAGGPTGIFALVAAWPVYVIAATSSTPVSKNLTACQKELGP